MTVFRSKVCLLRRFPKHGSSHGKIPLNARYLYDKAAVLEVTIKETLCRPIHDIVDDTHTK
jgi:hypothetical protein